MLGKMLRFKVGEAFWNRYCGSFIDDPKILIRNQELYNIVVMIERRMKNAR